MNSNIRPLHSAASFIGQLLSAPITQAPTYGGEALHLVCSRGKLRRVLYCVFSMADALRLFVILSTSVADLRENS